MDVPRTITHKNIRPLLVALQAEPWSQCGSKAPYEHEAWYWEPCYLEVPTGELAKDGLTTMALVGRGVPEHCSLTGKEGFVAQGLEGKVRIRKPLFNALMNLRDIVPEYRGRIVMA